MPARLASLLEREVRAARPHEACGVLLGRHLPLAFHVHAVRGGRNVHPEPERAFELDPGQVVAADAEARAQGLALIGFFHSHPSGPAVPSADDRRAAWDGHLGLILGLDPVSGTRTVAYHMFRTGWRRLELVRTRL